MEPGPVDTEFTFVDEPFFVYLVRGEKKYSENDNPPEIITKN